METVSGNLEVDNIKRCYVDGATIEVSCEKCGEILVTDFGAQYLSYPTVGEESLAYFYCEKCDEEYELPITIKSATMVMEFDKKNLSRA